MLHDGGSSATAETIFIDQYGFEYYGAIAEEFDKWDDKLRSSRRLRRAQLEKILANKLPTLQNKKEFIKFQSICRSGLLTTAENRGYLWAHSLGATDSRNRAPSEYSEKLKLPISEQVRADIECDLGRSIVNHQKFRGDCPLKLALRRVLRAVAATFPEAGYVQGMNIICGHLLIFMDEDLAYWSMVRILKGSPYTRHENDLGLLHYYTPAMKLLFSDMETLEKLIRSRSKARAALDAITKHDISMSQLFVKWFLTFTAGTLPPETTLRVWDSLFVEGIKVIFRIIIVILEWHKDAFVAAKDLEEVMRIWKRISECQFDHEALISQSLKVTSNEFKRKKIHTLERIQICNQE